MLSEPLDLILDCQSPVMAVHVPPGRLRPVRRRRDLDLGAQEEVTNEALRWERFSLAWNRAERALVQFCFVSGSPIIEASLCLAVMITASHLSIFVPSPFGFSIHVRVASLSLASLLWPQATFGGGGVVIVLFSLGGCDGVAVLVLTWIGGSETGKGSRETSPSPGSDVSSVQSECWEDKEPPEESDISSLSCGVASPLSRGRKARDRSPGMLSPSLSYSDGEKAESDSSGWEG